MREREREERGVDIYKERNGERVEEREGGGYNEHEMEGDTE
jgi:hypothetical protein